MLCRYDSFTTSNCNLVNALVGYSDSTVERYVSCRNTSDHALTRLAVNRMVVNAGLAAAGLHQYAVDIPINVTIAWVNTQSLIPLVSLDV